MKQTYIVLLINIAGMILSLLTMYLLTSSLSPIEYSIFAYLTITIALVSYFSFSGFDTIITRNYLYWQRRSKAILIKSYISNAINTRFILSFLILPIIWIYYYSLVIPKNPLVEDFIPLIMVLSIFESVNTTLLQITRSMNRFILAIALSFSTNIAGKLISIWLFFNFGFVYFMYSLLIGPLVVFFVLSMKLFCLYKFPDFNKLGMSIKKIYRNKEFLVLSYTKYIFSQLDVLVFSFVLPSEQIASYSIAKRIEMISKGIMDNVFDTMTQKVVNFKNDSKSRLIIYDHVRKVKRVLILLAFPMLLIWIFKGEDIINIVGLESYPMLCFYVSITLACILIKLTYKDVYNYINLLYKKRILFKIELLSALLIIVTYGLFYVLFPNLMIEAKLVCDLIVMLVFLAGYRFEN